MSVQGATRWLEPFLLAQLPLPLCSCGQTLRSSHSSALAKALSAKLPLVGISIPSWPDFAKLPLVGLGKGTLSRAPTRRPIGGKNSRDSQNDCNALF